MLLLFDKITETKAKVTTIYHSEVPVGAEGIEVAVISEPTPGQNQIGELYINPTNGELWYEYIEITSADVELQMCKEENAMLHIENEQLKVRITELEAQLGV